MSSEKEIKEKLEIKHEVEETMNSKTAFSDKVHKMTNNYLSIVFIEAFAMTFFAEWGDRSQISTIVLASRENIVGVSLGAIAGQCICNAIAVIGGGFVGQMISTRTGIKDNNRYKSRLTLIGGTMFLFFAVSSLLKF
ncbi:transmembrane protein-like protein [Leptotrombidium deliense]|uniref:GDT1 family protein n=1 Tax=Leptotrombidium deliense TaxID=299467 RepID=A0A443SWD6_9ACAR|nr:transmembrane protein-like protein [Leptotrombidium deliense]